MDQSWKRNEKVTTFFPELKVLKNELNNRNVEVTACFPELKVSYSE
jgi:hypothetical protein